LLGRGLAIEDAAQAVGDRRVDPLALEREPE
jgi:hypothetical protein